MSKPRIAVLATLDTKLEETRFLVDEIQRQGGSPITVNTGTNDVDDALVTVCQSEVRAAAGVERGATDTTDQKLVLMRQAADGARNLISRWVRHGEIDAVVALGGGQGSWVAAAAIRDLPVGFPRLLVSTAGRDVGQYTQFSDTASVFTITDVAGTNPLLKRVLATAAAGICGMSRSRAWREPLPPKLSAMTVYGITSQGAQQVMKNLGARGIETVAFHANGVGGPTMEAQIAAGTFAHVLDWSITELADDVVGGICAAGPERMTNAVRLGLSQLIVPGGIDVVNFREPESLPAHLRGRRTHAHTPEATLLRTNASENVQIAELLAERIRGTMAPIHVAVPMGGFSALSSPGGSLHDPAADTAFLETIRVQLADHPQIRITEHPADINSTEFAAFVADAFVDLAHGQTPNPDKE